MWNYLQNALTILELYIGYMACKWGVPNKWGDPPSKAVISDRGTKETTEPRDGIDDVEVSNALSHLQGKMME